MYRIPKNFQKLGEILEVGYRCIPGTEEILEIGCCWVTGTSQKKLFGTKFQFISTPVKVLEMQSQIDNNLRIKTEKVLNATLEELNKVRNELAEARHKLEQK